MLNEIDILKITPLFKEFGAVIHDFDLNQKLSAQQIAELEKVFHHYQIVVFKNQRLTPEAQIQMGHQFGEIELHPSEVVPWKYRELTYVANINPATSEIYPHCGPNFPLWHSDTCYLPNPAKFSFLYAEQVPSKGGETLFANMIAAYDDLPAEMKTKLEGTQAVFGSSQKLMARCQARGYALHIPEKDSEPDVIHPVIRTHPVTGKKSIYVNWAHTDEIVGFDEKESVTILNYLYEHCASPSYVQTYHYDQGDLIVWDNASTLHANTDEILTDVRIMRRVMVKGSKPF